MTVGNTSFVFKPLLEEPDPLILLEFDSSLPLATEDLIALCDVEDCLMVLEDMGPLIVLQAIPLGALWMTEFVIPRLTPLENSLLLSFSLMRLQTLVLSFPHKIKSLMRQLLIFSINLSIDILAV